MTRTSGSLECEWKRGVSLNIRVFSLTFKNFFFFLKHSFQEVSESLDGSV